MRRRLGAILVWGCAVLAMLLIVLAVRSAWTGDVVSCLSAVPENPEAIDEEESAALRESAFAIRSENGLLNFYWSTELHLPFQWRHESWPLYPESSAWRYVGTTGAGRFGFRYAEGYTRSRIPARQMYVPYYAVVAPLALPPVTWLTVRIFRRRRARRLKGRCPGCGYDLRASPERCPECGRSVNAAT